VFRVVIPARYASTRLPGKALVQLAGKTMIEWVYRRAKASRARSVVVATDDPRIASAVLGFGAEVAMTSEAHTSGTDRIAEVARMQHWPPGEIVVNVQGDEPLMPPGLIDQVAGLLEQHSGAAIATLAAPLHAESEMGDPHIVKVVTDSQGRALYFSRAPIPWNRDDPRASFQGARRHVGIYAYRVSALLKLASLQPTPLEQLEKLEQLRALENGMEIRAADCAEPPGADVNTPDDLQRAEALLRQIAAATPR
jgi:3-deoxy-manno-octulosonate cytidylyltransferase (CMP-KDO synthetase)